MPYRKLLEEYVAEQHMIYVGVRADTGPILEEFLRYFWIADRNLFPHTTPRKQNSVLPTVRKTPESA